MQPLKAKQLWILPLLMACLAQWTRASEAADDFQDASVATEEDAFGVSVVPALPLATATSEDVAHSVPAPTLVNKKQKKKKQFSDEELRAMAAEDAAGPSSIAPVHPVPIVDGALAEVASGLEEFVRAARDAVAAAVQSRDDPVAAYRIESFLAELCDHLAESLEEIKPEVKGDDGQLQGLLAESFDVLIAGLDVDPFGYVAVSRELLISQLSLLIRLAPQLLAAAEERWALAIQLRAMAAAGDLSGSLQELAEHTALFVQLLADSSAQGQPMRLSSLLGQVHERVFGAVSTQKTRHTNNSNNNALTAAKSRLPWPFSAHKQPSSSSSVQRTSEQRQLKRFLKLLDVLETVLTRSLTAPALAVSFFKIVLAMGARLRKLTSMAASKKSRHSRRAIVPVNDNVDQQQLQQQQETELNALIESSLSLEERNYLDQLVADASFSDKDDDDWIVSLDDLAPGFPTDMRALSGPLEEARFERSEASRATAKRIIGRIVVDLNEFPESDDSDDDAAAAAAAEVEIREPSRHFRQPVNFSREFKLSKAAEQETAVNAALDASNLQQLLQQQQQSAVDLSALLQQALAEELERLGSENLITAAAQALLRERASAAAASIIPPGTAPTEFAQSLINDRTPSLPLPQQLLPSDPEMSALLERMAENKLPELSAPSLLDYVKKSSLPKLLNSLIKDKFGVDVLKSLGQALRVLSDILGAAEVALRAILKVVQFVRYAVLQAAQFVAEMGQEEVIMRDDHSVPVTAASQMMILSVNKAAGMLSSGLAALAGPSSPFHLGLQNAMKKAREHSQQLILLPGPLVLSILHTAFKGMIMSHGILRMTMAKKHATFEAMRQAAVAAFEAIYESVKLNDSNTIEHLQRCPATIFAEALLAFLSPVEMSAEAIEKQFKALVDFLTPLLTVTSKDSQLSLLAFFLTAPDAEETLRLSEAVPESKAYIQHLSGRMNWPTM